MEIGYGWMWMALAYSYVTDGHKVGQWMGGIWQMMDMNMTLNMINWSSQDQDQDYRNFLMRKILDKISFYL
jgi:hypothetical protein